MSTKKTIQINPELFKLLRFYSHIGDRCIHNILRNVEFLNSIDYCKYSNEEIRKYMIITKLLQYQVAHTLQLIECLKLKNRVLDASDTGTGKTYTSIAVASILKLVTISSILKPSAIKDSKILLLSLPPL